MTRQHWIAFWTAAATFMYHSAVLGPMPQKLICSCCSVAQSCPTLWDPMDGSTPGFPIHHHLPVCSDSCLSKEGADGKESNHLILCHPFSCPQYFPASGSFPMSWLFSSSALSNKEISQYFLCPGSLLFFSYIFFLLSLLLVLLALQFLLFT